MKQTQKTITAFFHDRYHRAVYTMAMFELLKTDPDVIEIMDNETGELIYIA